MKKHLLTLNLLLLISAAFAQTGTWTAKTSMSIGRSTHTGFSLNGKGYVCAGMSSSNTDLKDLWQYDPGSNSWSQKADLPGDARRELSSFTIDSFAYVGHGRNVNTTEIFFSFYRYNPRTNAWSSIADCPVQRFTSTGFSIDSVGYITCGILPGVARYKDLYAYNPRRNVWTQKASLPSAALNRSYACVVSLNHKAYLMGGFEGQHMEDMYVYDPAANTWTQKANFPGGKRNSVAGFALGDYVLMGMGRDGGNSTYKDWYYYNPADNSWTAMNDYPEDNTAGHATFVINGKGYLCGGNDRPGTVRNYVYELSAPQLSIEKSATELRKLKLFKPEGSGVLHCMAYAGKVSVSVYDVNGRLVYSNSMQSDAEQEVLFPLDELSAGQYTAYVNNAGLKATLKLILN